MNEYDIVADLHTHTLVSVHAYSTVNENATEAERKGLIAVGITDHCPAAVDAPPALHFAGLAVLTDTIGSVRVLKGAEANVGEGGTLDLPEHLLARMEVLIASMHGGVMPTGSVDICTQAWLTVAENPHVDILGHPGAPEYAFDYETVIPAVGRAGKAIEINESSFRVRKTSYGNCRRIAELCMRHGVPVAVNSDAHFHAHIGVVKQSMEMLRDIGFPPELIVNGSRESLNRFFARKKLVFD